MLQIRNVLKLTIMLALSLGLLVFVGQGEARRSYSVFMLEKMLAQAELIQSPIFIFLQADQPLTQYPGFEMQTAPILEADPSLAAIYITLPDGTLLFNHPQDHSSEFKLADPEVAASFRPFEGLEQAGASENRDFYRVTWTLKNRVGEQGFLHLALPKDVIWQDINQEFQTVWLGWLLVVLVYSLFLFATSKYWVKPGGEARSLRGIRLLALSSAIFFLLVSAMVISALSTLYVNGIQARTQALAMSLSQRISTMLALGFSPDDFSDLQQRFEEYKQVNRDLSYVALSKDGKVVMSTQPEKKEQTWQPAPDQPEHRVRIVASDGSEWVVHMGISKSVLWQRLERPGRSFFALFIAVIVIAYISISLFLSQSNQPRLRPGKLSEQRGYLLSLIGPAYFALIFTTNGMTSSFLPQYFKGLAETAGMTADVSFLFSLYYLVYAVSLLFAGRYADEKDTRPLLVGGAGLVTLAFLLLATVHNFFVLLAVQVLTGLGEGIFFVAVQSYVLKVAEKKQRTQGAGIVVRNLYLGLLSGTAVGSLLAVDSLIGPGGVFWLGALVSLYVLYFVLKVVPSLAGEDFDEQTARAKKVELVDFGVLDTEDAGEQPLAATRQVVQAGITDAPSFWVRFRSTWADLWRQFRGPLADREFVLTVICIGVPVKIVLAGLFKASLPIVLKGSYDSTDDIGQILMFYYCGVLITSHFIARLADRWGKTQQVLVIGAVGSSLGLLMIGMTAWFGLDGIHQSLPALILVAGMFLLGIAHGFIQAPIMTHIASTQTAEKLGKATAISIYRLYERLGNIGGPVLVGAILYGMDYSITGIIWVGIIILVFGLGFALFPRR